MAAPWKHAPPPLCYYKTYFVVLGQTMHTNVINRDLPEILKWP